MLPGWIGGEYDIIAYGMDFQFLKPVYTGDHLTCKIVIEDVYEKNQKERIQFSYSIENGSKEIVLKGNMLGTPYIEN
ncbi:hypothetical protein LQU94_06770 [Peptoniphilus sp. KCTC 25270]|uniref:hypothetical protein n=1 Tax=Peptoniphilus sp. KCTC 25270 TaxID=2897414 RepID=UPI001E61D909|nr:hypothetical protein [Peptoniphilus sp. KCTC 25270]MCD1147814.1 hypothetical protein [Peptoniphilus sp. KCTC 25270]